MVSRLALATSPLRSGRLVRRGVPCARVRFVASDAAPEAPSPSFPRTLLHVLAWVPVALFVTGHVVSIASVKGTSMSVRGETDQPTFNPIDPAHLLYPSAPPPNDVVVLNRLIAATRTYRKGDIVTLASPTDPNLIITKRILALGGDTVELWVPRGRNLTPAPREDQPGGVTSMAYTHQYHHALRALASHTQDHARGAWLTITIPPHHAWVEGDASAITLTEQGTLRPEAKSCDSRAFGPVPMGLLRARIEWIVWPLSRFGRPGERP